MQDKFQMTQNAEQISAIKKSRIKNDENQNLLHKRQSQMRRDLKALKLMQERVKSESAKEWLQNLIDEFEASVD